MRIGPGLIERRHEPLCAETDPARLVASFLTAEADFFVRNHGPTPMLAPGHKVIVDGLVDRSARYSAAELAAGFPVRTVVATVQCAGNRRADLQKVAPTSGDPWDVGAIGTAEWTGVALADVLTAAGVGRDAAHVGLTGADLAEGGGAVAPYEVSLPVADAMRDGVLIAWAMNGAALTPEHGFPLRLIVPGAAGVRSVKWLARIELRAHEASAPMHARDYKAFGPDVTCATVDWTRGRPIYQLPVNAAICVPGDGARISAGAVTVQGWAMAGQGVARVAVSTDGGGTWIDAALERGPDAASWVLWTAAVDLVPGRHELTVRASDLAGGQQPADPATAWNFKGYLSNAWHRIAVTAA